MTNHPNRAKHQRGAHCIYRDMTARELDRAIDTQAELLAALKTCEEYMTACGYFAPKKDLAQQVRTAIAKTEGR